MRGEEREWSVNESKNKERWKKGKGDQKKQKGLLVNRVIHTPQKHESCWVAFCMGGDIIV